MSEPWAWGGEDGDDWYAPGHHDLETMKKMAEKYEVEDCGERPFLDSEFEHARLSHYWIRMVDEEHGVIVEEGEEGAEPMTSLYLPNRETG